MMALRYRCVDGITATSSIAGRRYKQHRAGDGAGPQAGYDTCSQLAREALATDKRVYDLVLEKGLLSQTELDQLLDPEHMAG